MRGYMKNIYIQMIKLSIINALARIGRLVALGFSDTLK